MNKTFALVGAAAAALMFAGAAHAADGGYVGVSYSDGNTSDLNAWSVDGKFAFGGNIQLDAGYTNIHDSAADLYGIGGHFFSRGDQWLWGAYLGYDRINGGGSDANEWTIAGQAQYYVDKTILSGNLSYSRTDSSGNNADTYQVTGDARFFATDNFSVNIGAGYGHLSTDFGDGNFLTYGVGGEWQPDQLPVSLYANVEAFDPEGSGNSANWTVGIRYNWGGSLYDRDRNGAGLSTPHGLLGTLL